MKRLWYRFRIWRITRKRRNKRKYPVKGFIRVMHPIDMETLEEMEARFMHRAPSFSFNHTPNLFIKEMDMNMLVPKFFDIETMEGHFYFYFYVSEEVALDVAGTQDKIIYRDDKDIK